MHLASHVKDDYFAQMLEIRHVDSSAQYEETNEGSYVFRLISFCKVDGNKNAGPGQPQNQGQPPKRRTVWLSETDFEAVIPENKRISLLIGFKKSMETLTKNEAMKSYAGKD